MHDFAITENHVVWFDLSTTLDLKSGLPFPHICNERYPVRIGVMSRDQPPRPPRAIKEPTP
jgi:carotenoid cleavage dioxygenase-like enzyme